MASTFILNSLGIRHRGDRVLRETAGSRFSPPGTPVDLLARCVCQLLFPPAQQELSAALLVPLVAQHCQTVRKRLQEITTVAVLHFLGTFSGRGRGLPLVNLGRNRNSPRRFERRLSFRAQQAFHSLGLQPPLSNQPVRGQAALQQRRGDAVLIETVEPSNRAQSLDIEISVLDL